MDDSGPGTPSLKYRLKKSLCCCFSSAESSTGSIVGYHSAPTTPRMIRSSSQWIKSRSNEFPEFKDRCRSLISRIGHNHRRRRSHSTDFRYDPLSYALNFEGGEELDSRADEYLPLRNFTARLPHSPIKTEMPMSAPAISAKKVTEFNRPQRTSSDGVVERRVGISREISACS